jgi:hypothetical protein
MISFNKLGVLVVTMPFSMACSRNAIGAETQSHSTTTNSMAAPGTGLALPKSTVWQSGVGEGFLPTAQTFSLEAGVAPGIAAFGSQQANDLALLSLTYGHMLGHVVGKSHWYRGNFEGRLELFGGGRYSPSSEWVIGLTPLLRYNFATGTRWIPFLDGGAGVTATGIGAPDLGGTFEFNLQAATGVHLLLRDDLALTREVRFMHLSSAGIHHPNLGMNNVLFMIGLTWFFGR